MLHTNFRENRPAGVLVYLAPWTACPPGGKPTVVGLPSGGQAVPGNLTPTLITLTPRGGGGKLSRPVYLAPT